MRPKACAVVVLFACGSALAATIAGTVTYDGTAPSAGPIDMGADAACAKMHATPQPSDVLVLGPGNAMANVMVSVSSGLPAGKTWPVAKDPVVLDQSGCHYAPHVLGLMVGQPFKVQNPDGILHTVHSFSKANARFNMAMPPNVKEATKSFGKAEGMFVIKCDVHPWMASYAGVFSHPFFSVTKGDGRFSLSGLDAGTYELTAWHEQLGVRTVTVTVKGDETTSVDFTFTAPAAK